MININYLEVLKDWSVTYFKPIQKMPDQLQKTVSSLYLTLRAIDEIEDSEKLTREEKVNLIEALISSFHQPTIQAIKESVQQDLNRYSSKLDDVTLSLPNWIQLAPESISFRISDCGLSMMERMLPFIKNGFRIDTEKDLSRYFYAVAGTPGLCLSDIWEWYENKSTSRKNAVSFGYFLQSINVLRGSQVDGERGVSFFPKGWKQIDMIEYANKFKKDAENYMNELGEGDSYNSCKILFDYSVKILNAIEQKEQIPFDGINKP